MEPPVPHLVREHGVVQERRVIEKWPPCLVEDDQTFRRTEFGERGSSAALRDRLPQDPEVAEVLGDALDGHR